MKLENPTSRDIADLAGVSQATVSRALRNSPLVRPETRRRIQEIAKELNYFVNRNAAGLRTHQSNTIALLVFDETEGEDAQINPFFLSMLGYITRAAARTRLRRPDLDATAAATTGTWSTRPAIAPTA